MIETTAPLADRSEESVKAAVIAAIDKAVRGASAMGFAWFQLRDAQVTEHEVAVQILATDKDPGEVEEVDPGAAPAPPEASTDDGNVTEGPVPAWLPGVTPPLWGGRAAQPRVPPAPGRWARRVRRRARPSGLRAAKHQSATPRSAMSSFARTSIPVTTSSGASDRGGRAPAP